jgi:signal transduction histidine kinase
MSLPNDRLSGYKEEYYRTMPGNSVGYIEHSPYALLFEHAPVAIWLEDFSEIYQYLTEVAAGAPLASVLEDRAIVIECIRRVRILHVNRTAREFYGAVTSEELTLQFEQLFDEASVELFRQELCAFAEGREVFQTEVFAKTLRGDERLVQMNCSLVPDQASPWSFLIVTFTDVEERRVLEQHLRASERRAQDYARSLALLNKDLENFAYAAAHDLREPIRTVALYAQYLEQLQRDHPSPRAETAVQFILASTQRMQQLITDLLTFAQTAGAPPSESPVCDPGQIAGEVVLSLNAAIQEAGATIHVQPLPRLAVQSGHFRQALQNLLSNAIKYRHPDRPLRIEVSADLRPGNRARITVADNGSGIKPEYQERIFAIFHRLHGQEVQGSGIGLALCARIAAMYHGRTWVESDGISGSAFYIELPVVPTPRHSIDEA